MLKPNSMTHSELSKEESTITEYINLVDEFLSMDHGVAWKPEEWEREEKMRMEIARLRQELDMEPLSGFPF